MLKILEQKMFGLTEIKFATLGSGSCTVLLQLRQAEPASRPLRYRSVSGSPSVSFYITLTLFLILYLSILIL